MRIAILGLGLMGGSLGLALSEDHEIWGYDPQQTAGTLALERGAIGHLAKTPQEAVSQAEVVFLAAPVGCILPLLQQIASAVGPRTILSDLASTKEEICAGARGALSGRGIFIGGHPMAGSHKAGVGAADPRLMENAIYALTPEPETPAWAIEKLREVLAPTGAHLLTLNPKAHDQIVAASSHLPHLAAVALTNVVTSWTQAQPQTLVMAGRGFRDTTRIAAGSPELWQEILLSNPALPQAIEALRQELNRIEGLIVAQDRTGLTKALAEAAALRRQFPERAVGLLAGRGEILVQVPDEPGAISQVTGLLALSSINIVEIGILRSREGEEGPLWLVLEDQSQASLALSCLARNGITAVKK